MVGQVFFGGLKEGEVVKGSEIPWFSFFFFFFFFFESKSQRDGSSLPSFPLLSSSL